MAWYLLQFFLALPQQKFMSFVQEVSLIKFPHLLLVATIWYSFGNVLIFHHPTNLSFAMACSMRQCSFPSRYWFTPADLHLWLMLHLLRLGHSLLLQTNLMKNEVISSFSVSRLGLTLLVQHDLLLNLLWYCTQIHGNSCLCTHFHVHACQSCPNNFGRSSQMHTVFYSFKSLTTINPPLLISPLHSLMNW